MHRKRINYLFQKYSDKTASESERDELMEFVATASKEEISSYLEAVYDTLSKEDKQYFLSASKKAVILDKVFENKHSSTTDADNEKSLTGFYRNQLWVQYASIAALLFIVLSIGFLFYKNYNRPQHHHVAQNTSSIDIEPGGNKATLTLEDGSTITLDELQDGQIAEQSGIVISKMNGGQLLYSNNGINKGLSRSGFNTISTPRGGEFQIILPDGTKVWLNAASSLKFPTQFSQTERKVELQGEGYFEVAKNTTSPFIVSTKKQNVTVLGTHFNINSYEDEGSVKTTLIEGSVQVSLGSITKGDESRTAKVRLKPNQQSILAGAGLNVIDVNGEESIAWKDGYFNFQHADLPMVMRQLSRWYDIDVVYQGEIPSETFTGKVYRNMNISEVFEVLEFAQVNFKIEGKKMIIYS